MYIEELKEGDSENEEGEQLCCKENDSENGDGLGGFFVWDAKMVFAGVGARALFYPTLLYNVVRNKIQSEFRWWDRVDEFVLLGAVPFPKDVPRLKALGVGGVVTLNEPYETLVPTLLYQDHNIKHLVIPTRDYLFAPSYGVICQAVEFIHGNTFYCKTTYVHCKAGRGRSTAVVICYLVKYKNMTPEAAYKHVRSIRPRVQLASSQWKAVQDYYYRLKKPGYDICMDNSPGRTLDIAGTVDLEVFDDNSMVLITKSDLDGYEESDDSHVFRKNIMADVNLACRVQFASQAAISRLSCLWLRCHVSQKASGENMESCIGNNQLGNTGVDIRVY